MKKNDASILVYKLKVTYEQKLQMINKIQQINEEGSAYNLLGLLTGSSNKPNIMYCSQFLYSMLDSVGAIYFNKPRKSLKPTDFIERDYERKLEFVEKITW